ncbi:MAG: 4Fe-4S dicluster domain-containing protein [Clostridia bacterium]|nr:4Fe-4S dicluster domain-containing protein [Clostridia bacterium]MBP3554051.1 4Fe-4S dicluster domain-containing protein [Clostridia bacterium]
MLKILRSQLDELFALIAEKETLYIPTDATAGIAQFKKWENGMKMSDKLKTSRSAKDFFFPQTEDLVSFKKTGKKIDIIDPRTETEDFVIFGVRACDCRSFDILDRVFLAEPVDTYYKNRREHGTVVTLACSKPAETCFCQTFGIDPTAPAGDVSAWMTEDAVYFNANTEKGNAFVDVIKALATESDDTAVEAQKAATKEILAKLPIQNLKTEAFGGGKTEQYFKSPEWAELSEACLGCGTCTFVCPTCQCYDIRDFDTGHGIDRFRCWDSCMYSDFTKMAHGNPRLSQKERFRQRFMHKLVYYPENNEGIFGCVGCGRCVEKCPISMNIVKVMRTLAKEDEGK